MDVLYQACQLSCERWINEIEKDDTEKHIFSKEHQRKMHNICSKINYQYFSKKMIIAIIAALVALLITTSVFALTKYKKYIIEQFANHSIYSVLSDNKTKDMSDLEIKYIPNGFLIEEENSTNSFQQKIYSKEDIYINIKKYKLGTDISFDTEEYNYEELEINGIKYVLYSDEHDLTGAIWNNNEYQFLVFGNIDKSEILKIIESIN